MPGSKGLPEGITIKIVEPSRWPEIKKEVMKIENVDFSPAGLNESEEEMGETFTDPDSACYIAKNGAGEMVAYLTAGPIEDFDYQPFIEEDPEFGKRTTFYVASIAVLPEYQGKGIGKRMLKMVIEEAWRRGYSRLTGHFLELSSSLFAKVGGRLVKSYPDFYGKGEKTDYMELKLR